ncbi:MAG TPA: hypothetical protein PKE26_01370 [Kiritimatiellia bacterium]|nr:hypothetical protein [Kiritimatiellia bacterium]HMO97742.1 hypothetical protein [Kiritimatiellia bacterium]HMP95381.1 hypothetical protein [Kiritimatiellia bacterium]
MKMKYHTPEIVGFDQQALGELIGPVQTQYACDCNDPDIPPLWKEFNVATLPVSVDTAGCPGFDTVEIRFSSQSQTLPVYNFNRADGSFSGSRWEVLINSFSLPGAPGELFNVTITLLDDGLPVGKPCVTTIQVQGINDEGG